MNLRKFKFIVAALCYFISSKAHSISPGGAATLSLIPGAGEFALGNRWTGVGYFTGVIGLLVAQGDSDGATLARTTGVSLYCYQMYDAYRDAKPTNKMYGKGTLTQNYLAAFNPVNAWDPFSVGFVGLGATQVKKQRKIYGNEAHRPYHLAYFAFAVQQEEALYRGFLYPFFTDVFGGSKFFGAFTSSALDAFQHYFYLGPGALHPVMFSMRTVLFMLLTWQFDYNDYEIAPGVFAHAWYDYLLGAGLHKKDGDEAKSGSSGDFRIGVGIRY